MFFILRVTISFKISKKGIHVVVLFACYRHANVELGNSIVNKVMAKKTQSKLMTTNIQTLFFAVADHAQQH